MNPLDQLADIRIPDDPSSWPPALGYWLILGAVLLIIVALAVYQHQRKRKLAERNKSLAAIHSICIDDQQALQQIHHVLKTAAQQYLPQKRVLQMQAEQWALLLTQLYHGKHQQQICQPLVALAKWQYDQRTAIENTQHIKLAAQRWIKGALPPKKGAADV